MKENINCFFAGMAVSFVVLLFINKCEHKDNFPPQRIEVIKKQVDTLKVEVVKLKDAKTKIIYKTKFDTLATIDTVLVELKKCDTIVKIDSVIIQKQDTIIKGQETIISDLDSHNQVLEADIKKQKRKLIFTKILAGAVIVLTIIATTR